MLSAIKGISILSFAYSQIYLSSAVYLGMPSIATPIPGTILFIGEDAPFQNCSKSGFSTNGVLCIAKKTPVPWVGRRQCMQIVPGLVFLRQGAMLF